MTDSRANVEIEDVLSSIRRLVSQDVPPVARTVPAPGQLRAAVTPLTPVAPVAAAAPAVTEETLRTLNLRAPAAPAAATPPEVPAPEAAEANDFLVLTPALRVSDAAEEDAAEAEDDAWEVEDLSGPQALSEADDWVVEEVATPEAPHAEAMPQHADEAETHEVAAEEVPEAEAAEAPFWEDAVSEDALDLAPPQGGSVTAWPHGPALRRGEDAVDLVAETAAGADPDDSDAGFVSEAEAAALADPAAEGLTLDYADDLGEELARLEHKIAEMEAAVALDSQAFEADADAAAVPGAGDGFAAEAAAGLSAWEEDAARDQSLEPIGDQIADVADEWQAEGDEADPTLEEPLVDPWGAPGESWDDLAALDGASEADMRAGTDVADGEAGTDASGSDALDADGAEGAYGQARAAADLSLTDPDAEAAEDADEDGASAGAFAEASVATEDADPEQALWADSGALDWSDEDVDATPAAAYEAGPRRLHLADAQEEPHHPRILRSTYEQLRSEEVPFEDEAEEGLFDEGAEGLMDEEALRVLVSEMIRQELQGTLGERITRNVRKLVRREIQRALSSQDFD
ncbi:hypothetical protein [Phaeovulum sp. W22_SRMD_FR3]|uniref:hypothetical protein n=1 Tax=Phaeovulum sp. W22_SRMD_FR3 TaxID=3240274 RepID=UPI003F9DCD1D